LIKLLKPLAKYRRPRPLASCCEIIGLAAAARHSALWRPELTGTARVQGQWRARSKVAGGRRVSHDQPNESLDDQSQITGAIGACTDEALVRRRCWEPNLPTTWPEHGAATRAA
jgi:hypothetical protein